MSQRPLMPTPSNLDFWKGSFGNDYHERNHLAPSDIARGAGQELGARVAHLYYVFSRVAADATRVDSLPGNWPSPARVMEVGCGTGNNFAAISRFDPDCQLYGCEPNAMARGFVEHFKEHMGNPSLHSCSLPQLHCNDESFDLVMTMGVLIHIPPQDIEAAVSELIRVSKRYIYVCEYFAPSEEMVPYQDRENMLWRRDYGSLLLARDELEFVEYGFNWRPVNGLDNTTWWLFKKRDKKDVGDLVDPCNV